VDDLLELFDLRIALEDEDEYDTVGGLVYHRIGGVPEPGHEIRVDGLRLTVETTDGRRVGKVLVVRERPVDDSAAGETKARARATANTLARRRGMMRRAPAHDGPPFPCPMAMVTTIGSIHRAMRVVRGDAQGSRW
jgi:hypothetical protein